MVWIFKPPVTQREVQPVTRRDTVEAAVKSDIEDLGDLVGVEPSLAAAAIKLAQAIDGDDGRMLPALTRELRITMKALADGRDDEDDDDADLGTAA